MVLDHVAQRTRAFVIACAVADALGFRDRDLDVIDVFLVEQRLEDAVGEPKHQDVLYRFFPEIVIDAVHLVLVEDLRDRVVDGARTLQIVADRLLDHDARRGPRGAIHDEPRAIELFHCGDEQRRRHGQVIQAIAGQPAFVFHDVQPRAEAREGAVDRGARPEQVRGECRPRMRVDRPPRERLDAGPGELPVVVVGHRFAADAGNRHARRQQPVEMEVVERRQQFPVCQVAGAAEDDDRHRLGGDRRRRARRELFVQRRVGRREDVFRHRACSPSPRVRRTDCATRRGSARQRDCPGASRTA